MPPHNSHKKAQKAQKRAIRLFCAFCAFLWLAFLCGFSWREPESGEWREIDLGAVEVNAFTAAVDGGVGVHDEVVIIRGEQFNSISFFRYG